MKYDLECRYDSRASFYGKAVIEEHEDNICKSYQAIEWQLDFSNHNYSWGEIAEWTDYFYKMGKRYGLLKEFRENCIC